MIRSESSPNAPSAQVTAQTAGIEMLWLTSAEYGTKAYPGVASRAALQRTGASIGVSPTRDWTKFEFVGLAEDFDSTWSVFSDRLLNPLSMRHRLHKC